MVDNLQAGSTVNDFVIWHDGNDNGLLQKIKITGDIISHWEYDENRVVQIHAEVQNDSHEHTFANLLEKPTTLDGYGITDGVHEGDTVTLYGAVTGTADFDANGNLSLTTTATSDPTLTLAGDVTGNCTFTNLGDATLTITILDDSHEHTFSNITDKPTTIAGYGITDGVQEGDTVTLTGDAIGSGTFDSNGNISISTTVALESHNHDSRYYTETEIDDTLGEYWNASQVEAEITKSSPIGLRGQVNFIAEDGTRDTELDWLIKEGKFVDSSEALTVALESSISNAEVFTEWNRFSHLANTEAQPANASELNNWEYNTSSDTISCTINSATHIGFYSNKKIDKYDIDLQLSSTVGDDDMMGMVIAFAIDGEGREHSLTAIRTNTTWVTNQWLIIYNYLRSDQWIITYDTSILDGGTWNSYSIGTRIKVSRDGDLITAFSTQNNSAAFVPESELNVDLTSDPRLAVFRGPQAYGYSCHSQDNSTFSDIKFTEYGAAASDNYVFDIENDAIYVPDGNGGYVIDATKTLASEVGPGKLIRDIFTKQTWYLSPTGEVESLTSGAAFLPLTGGIVSGDLTVTNNLSAGTITETSARKYKEDISTIDNSLDILQELNGVHYRWKESQVKDIGFIADDVLEILPELVTLKDGEIEGMNYGKLTAVLVNGVKELTQRVKYLENIIDKEGDI